MSNLMNGKEKEKGPFNELVEEPPNVSSHAKSQIRSS